jgi:glycerol-3-phosphate dehydrogenase (NAD(P)+)
MSLSPSLPLPIISRACVLGGGAYGTAMAQVLGRMGKHVKMWVREKEVVESINNRHENEMFLKKIPLSENITATQNIKEALDGAQIVMLVIPTPFLRSTMVANRSVLPVGVPLVCCAKGIENETLECPYEILVEELPGKYHHWIACLSGPSFAEEVALGQPTSVLVASKNVDVAIQIQFAMSDDTFRVYTGTDVMGAELGGAVKNVLAIACGAAAGYGFGSNTAALLMTRGLMEMTKLAVKKGALPSTMMGLAGMGDLVLTCTSIKSRNYTVGYRIAKGETLSNITGSTGAVAEGVKTALSIHDLAKSLGVEMPICEEVYQVLHHSKPFPQALLDLKSRPLIAELEGFEHDLSQQTTASNSLKKTLVNNMESKL